MSRFLAYLTCVSFGFCLSVNSYAPALAQPAPGTANFDINNPPTQTVVMRGETLFTIAERTRSPLQALIRTNNLNPPYAISPGQILALPPLKVHVVTSNETFGVIAQRYNIDERSLAVFNKLARPVRLQAGQRLILPPMVIDRFTGLEPQDLLDLLANEMAAGRPVSGRVAGVIVRDDEATPTQSDVKLEPTAREPDLNMIGPSADGFGNITSPQQVQKYGPSEDGDGIAVRSKPIPLSEPRNLVSTLSSLSRAAVVASTPAMRASRSTLPNLTDMPTASTTSNFIWPIAGRVVETFGTKRDLRTIDGIEIEAPAGAPFKAAASGTIVYVGNQLPGYGWLVLIRHAGNLMSAYAYAQSVQVRENQTVRQGQVIGLVGATGRAITPRLHFQIRQNTLAIDPILRLPNRSATAGT